MQNVSLWFDSVDFYRIEASFDDIQFFWMNNNFFKIFEQMLSWLEEIDNH